MSRQQFDWRFAQSWQLYTRIPMKGASILPDEGFDQRVINVRRDYPNDVPARAPIMMTVHCLPKGRGKHRLLVVCECGRDVPIGRMVSHAPTCQPFQTKHGKV